MMLKDALCVNNISAFLLKLHQMAMIMQSSLAAAKPRMNASPQSVRAHIVIRASTCRAQIHSSSCGKSRKTVAIWPDFVYTES